MCTVFSGKKYGSNIIAKNYDCFIDGGMIFTNKRHVKRKSLVLPPEKEFVWISQYGSLTFSQSGKGMPVCGMNEQGLIVEQATLPDTVYSDEPGKMHISCLEAIQYILDCCKNVEHAIQAFTDFSISNQSFGKLHYFLADKCGARTIVEFINGKMHVFQGKEMLPLITNSRYENLGTGENTNKSEYENDSFRRFEIVKSELEKRDSLTVEQAFSILKQAERADTAWSVVYDLENDSVWFRDGNQRIKEIKTNEIDYSENATSYLYDLETNADGFVWEQYSRRMNRKNVEKFYGNDLVLQMMNLPDTDFIINAFDTHITQIEEEIVMEKILLIDVDGTLVDYENNLPGSAVKAIQQARKNGHKVYICTGRSRAEVYENIWAIGLDGMIGGNGSYVEHQGCVVMHQLITAEQCRHIVDWLHERGLEFYLESNNGLFGSERFAEAAQSAVQEYSKRKGKENAQQITVTDVFPEMIFGAELYRDDVNKVSFLLNGYEDYLDAVNEFPDLKPGTWGGKGETALFGDLGVQNITKAHAIDVLLEAIGESKEETFAFGDAKIDIPMLEYCHVGVAMNSGGDEIKKMADYVTDDVDKDGLYKAFVHFGLIAE